jgi:hypothetical protein
MNNNTGLKSLTESDLEVVRSCPQRKVISDDLEKFTAICENLLVDSKSNNRNYVLKSFIPFNHFFERALSLFKHLHKISDKKITLIIEKKNLNGVLKNSSFLTMTTIINGVEINSYLIERIFLLVCVEDILSCNSFEGQFDDFGSLTFFLITHNFSSRPLEILEERFFKEFPEVIYFIKQQTTDLYDLNSARDFFANQNIQEKGIILE